MQAWTVLVGLIPCVLTQDIYEAVLRGGFVPFSGAQALFGTSESPYGAFQFPLHAPLASLLAQPPFLSQNEFPPRDGRICTEFRKKQKKAALFEQRVQQKKENLGPAQPVFLSMIDDPAEMATYTADELYCLFYLGYEPPRIGHGLAFGRLYHLMGNQLLGDLSSILWGGKIIFELPCQSTGKNETICLNQAGRFPVAWTHMSLGKEPAYTKAIYHNPEEALSDDADGALWVDYSAEFGKICPASVPRFYDSPPGRTNGLMNLAGGPGAIFPTAQVSLGILENAFPVTKILDCMRWVGRDEVNKQDIYLGKAMGKFSEGYRPGQEELRVLAWFNLKIGDKFTGKTIVH